MNALSIFDICDSWEVTQLLWSLMYFCKNADGNICLTALLLELVH